MSKYSTYSNGGRLLSLGRKVGQIAGKLADPPSNDRLHESHLPFDEIMLVRRLRYRFFPDRLFGEPAWDILLELLLAQAEDRDVTLADLSEAAGVIGTVALRWVDVLESEGLVRRRPDPRDPPTQIIQLEPKADAAFRHLIEELAKTR